LWDHWEIPIKNLLITAPKDPNKDESQEIQLITRKPEVTTPKAETPREYTFNFEPVAPSPEPMGREKSTAPEEPRPIQKQEQLSEPEKAFVSVRKPVQEPEPETGSTDNAHQQKQAQERIQKLRDLSLKLKSAGGLAEMEREPAYIRKKMELKDPPPNTGQQTSRYTLSSNDENNTDIRSNNSYLHDNVD
jgi:cell division protein FtsZ